MLSEPLAFAYSGWFMGTILIVMYGAFSCYTYVLLVHSLILLLIYPCPFFFKSKDSCPNHLFGPTFEDVF